MPVDKWGLHLCCHAIWKLDLFLAIHSRAQTEDNNTRPEKRGNVLCRVSIKRCRKWLGDGPGVGGTATEWLEL